MSDIRTGGIPHWDMIEELLREGWIVELRLEEPDDQGRLWGDFAVYIGDSNCHHRHGYNFESTHGFTYVSDEDFYVPPDKRTGDEWWPAPLEATIPKVIWWRSSSHRHSASVRLAKTSSSNVTSSRAF